MEPRGENLNTTLHQQAAAAGMHRSPSPRLASMHVVWKKAFTALTYYIDSGTINLAYLPACLLVALAREIRNCSSSSSSSFSLSYNHSKEEIRSLQPRRFQIGSCASTRNSRKLKSQFITWSSAHVRCWHQHIACLPAIVGSFILSSSSSSSWALLS